MRRILQAPRRISKAHVVNVVAILLIVAFIFPFVAHAIPGVIGASESYVVKSGSMEPALETGSVIFVYETQPETIEEGDIIVYDLRGENRKVTTHRVVEVNRDDGLSFRTKGDANEEADPYTVPAQSVIGTVPVIEPLGVPATVPYLGQALIYLSSKWAIFWLAMVPAGLLIVTEIYALVREARASGSNEQSVTDWDGSHTEEGNR